MHDGVDPVERREPRPFVANVARNEVEAFSAPEMKEGAPAPDRQRVQNADGRSPVEQLSDERRPEIAGAAGDEDAGAHSAAAFAIASA